MEAEAFEPVEEVDDEPSVDPPDEQEILRKIREVSMNNAEFDEMVKRYMNEA